MLKDVFSFTYRFFGQAVERLSYTLEKRLLQGLIFCLAFVPIIAGGSGILLGPDIYLANLSYTPAFDSHFHYLSGLLFAIGIGYWVCVPHIELRHGPITILSLIIFIGGLSRLLSLPVSGFPGWVMLGALCLEILIVPILWAWQTHLAHRYLVEIKHDKNGAERHEPH